MKRRKVGRDFTKRLERYLERPDGPRVTALFCEHWSRENDPAGIAREAAAWLRSQELPDRPPAGRSLCEHLRSDHGARHDWPEDLAARIIDLVAVLEEIERLGEDWFNAEVPGEVGVHPSLERVRTKYWYTVGVAVDSARCTRSFPSTGNWTTPAQKPRLPSASPGPTRWPTSAWARGHRTGSDGRSPKTSRFSSMGGAGCSILKKTSAKKTKKGSSGFGHTAPTTGRGTRAGTYLRAFHKTVSNPRHASGVERSSTGISAFPHLEPNLREELLGCAVSTMWGAHHHARRKSTVLSSPTLKEFRPWR